MPRPTRPDSQSSDTIYATADERLVDFAFDARVAAVFTDMIRRSVPGYETLVPLTGLIAAQHIRAQDRCYDLGCSLGATTLAIVEQLGDRACEIVAVDNSPAMLKKARSLHDWDSRVSFEQADIRDIEFSNAGAVTMNFTLQFIPPADRLTLLTRIRRGLRPGGALILSEKLAGEPTLESLHTAFKQANGYSQLEISRKRAALENTLIPDALDAHLNRLAQAGFGDVQVWFRCLNWASFLARA